MCILTKGTVKCTSCDKYFLYRKRTKGCKLFAAFFSFTFAARKFNMGKIAINIATGSLQKEEIIVGIDLGTTNSLIAIIHPDTKQPVALKEHNSASLVPSVI